MVPKCIFKLEKQDLRNEIRELFNQELFGLNLKLHSNAYTLIPKPDVESTAKSRKNVNGQDFQKRLLRRRK